jgi:hypothetical protein
MQLGDKTRKIIYWATLGVSAFSAVFMGVGAALGVIDPGAVQKGAEVAALILGVVTPIVALLHFTPTPPSE